MCCRGPLAGALPPSSSSSVAGGATRAARLGATPGAGSGGPDRADGSCRQRNFLGHSVGTAEVPGPLPPLCGFRLVKSSLDRRVSLPEMSAAARGGFSQPANLPLGRFEGARAVWENAGGPSVALSAASQGWRATAGKTAGLSLAPSPSGEVVLRRGVCSAWMSSSRLRGAACTGSRRTASPGRQVSLGGPPRRRPSPADVSRHIS